MIISTQCNMGNGLNMSNKRTFWTWSFMSEGVRKKQSLKFHPLHFQDKVAWVSDLQVAPSQSHLLKVKDNILHCYR